MPVGMGDVDNLIIILFAYVPKPIEQVATEGAGYNHHSVCCVMHSCIGAQPLVTRFNYCYYIIGKEKISQCGFEPRFTPL
jgi:hypothetical protein